MRIADPPSGAPTAAAVMARAAGENFPVASRMLPRRERVHLLAIYGFARLVDELGDSAQGDRLAALDWLEGELDAAFAGEAQHPLMRALSPTLRECGLAREPFLRLIEANRTDQRVTRYESWQQLRAYCALSADPVGELVLGVIGAATPARVERSDAICTALQLTEHCQDVAEDFAQGRVYLPAEDLARFGCGVEDLGAEHASEPLRAVLAFEVARARELFASGEPLIDELHGRARLAVAAFVAGGRAALDAIERAGYDVLPGAPRAGAARRALALAATLRGRRAPANDAVSAAYERCEAVTRAEAANFYYGIRLLPRPRRRAMSAVYAFARRIDDIGDGELPAEEKLRLLDSEERALGSLEPGAGGAGTGDPVLRALADAHERFALPREAFAELIEGVRMDVRGATYESFDDLVSYCRRVAGTIGRISLAILGLREDVGVQPAEAEAVADELGVALQLTNILRDIGEDAERGRVYLPREDLVRFELVREDERRDVPRMLAVLAGRSAAAEGRGEELDGRGRRERLAELMRFEAARARQWFIGGMELAPLLDRRSGACVLAMAGIYRRLLERIAASPEQAIGTRVSLPVREKAWVAARGMLGGASG
jgi:15-cis-phytoene synthase